MMSSPASIVYEVTTRSSSMPVTISTSIFLFFFFQAEDGIRDLTVTGVQTCALPICFPASLLDCVSLQCGFRAVAHAEPRCSEQTRCERYRHSFEGGGRRSDRSASSGYFACRKRASPHARNNAERQHTIQKSSCKRIYHSGGCTRL